MTRLFLACLAVAVALCGCGSSPSGLKRLRPEETILAFGDSLTYGYGSTPGHSYPEMLAGISGMTVVNAGVPGEESGEAVARLPQLLDRYNPSLVLLCEGGNDMLRGRDRQALVHNLREMIRMSRLHGAQVVLIGVPTPTLKIFSSLKTDPVYGSVATTELVPVEDEVLARVLSDPSLKSDTVHPNDEGNQEIAMAMHLYLRKLGAI